MQHYIVICMNSMQCCTSISLRSCCVCMFMYICAHSQLLSISLCVLSCSLQYIYQFWFSVHKEGVKQVVHCLLFVNHLHECEDDVSSINIIGTYICTYVICVLHPFYVVTYPKYPMTIFHNRHQYEVVGLKTTFL